MGRIAKELTKEPFNKDKEKSLTLTEENVYPKEMATGTPKTQETGTAKRGRKKIRRSVPFRESLKKILSLEISPSSVSEEITSTPLGDKITYGEAIIIAQVLKAARGDNQAIGCIQKLWDAEGCDGAVLRLEDFM